MKLYLRELVKVTTPSENIVALDNLRRKYGEHKRDEQGAYFEVDNEVMLCLPSGVTAHALHEGQAEQ